MNCPVEIMQRGIFFTTGHLTDSCLLIDNFCQLLFIFFLTWSRILLAEYFSLRFSKKMRKLGKWKLDFPKLTPTAFPKSTFTWYNIFYLRTTSFEVPISEAKSSGKFCLLSEKNESQVLFVSDRPIRNI